MTCRELIGFLDRYLDGSIEPASREAFERHLATCTSCRDFLRTYRDTIVLTRHVCVHDDDPVPPEVPADLVRAVMHASTRRG